MKIDVSKIEGYVDMTAEEKIAALEAYEEEPDYTGYVKKEVFDKASKEAASYKKQLKEKMTEDEKKAQEDAEKMQEMMAELAELKKKDAISNNYAKFIALGYEDNLAKETAEAIVDGDFDKVFANQAKHQSDTEKKLKAELLKQTPVPPVGAGTVGVTKETFAKMSLDEKAKLFASDPEAFEKLTK